MRRDVGEVLHVDNQLEGVQGSFERRAVDLDARLGATVVELSTIDELSCALEEEEDNLITFREYIHAIQSLKTLHKTILPRTLSFKEVLLT